MSNTKNSLASIIKKKKRKKMINITSKEERGDSTIDPTDIQNIKR